MILDKQSQLSGGVDSRAQKPMACITAGDQGVDTVETVISHHRGKQRPKEFCPSNAGCRGSQQGKPQGGELELGPRVRMSDVRSDKSSRGCSCAWFALRDDRSKNNLIRISLTLSSLGPQSAVRPNKDGSDSYSCWKCRRFRRVSA